MPYVAIQIRPEAAFDTPAATWTQESNPDDGVHLALTDFIEYQEATDLAPLVTAVEEIVAELSNEQEMLIRALSDA